MECLAGDTALQRITKMLEDCEPATSPSSHEDVPEEQPRSLQKSISVSDFQRGAYQRMQQYQRRKEEHLKQARLQKEAEAVAEVRTTPRINKYPELKRVPLSDRVPEIQQKQKEWREKQAQTLKAQAEARETAELTFHPKILTHSRCRRTSTEFELYLESAKDKRQAQLQKLKQDVEAKSSADLRFTPTLCARSQQLVKNKGDLAQRLEEGALLSELRHEDLRKKYEPSFRPAISPLSARLAEKRPHQPIHERLYPPPLLQQVTQTAASALQLKDLLSA